ncbi:type IV secretion system protein VirB10 [Aggregatibacter actinomycetemcomitans]|uniref:type IV secretion system protein VirB10 n=1 Tax=Aggregatibacter actinomycetemcomitans TaxID=714 RepID=UPI00197CA5E7|nr:type IV secretion system protein VirB10 [Aggregatibacter actinomycetemcomitans]MBN6059382.1 type IV secretion system protein VirB10 [Aggregatibacter actinomycetemcomitans]MBN6087883.1 type IV secretion system protein VirB10 [Aggregatibacter actinomycetemcomitans]
MREQNSSTEKPETDYTPEVGKIAKRGRSPQIFIFFIILILGVAFAGFSLWKKANNKPQEEKSVDNFGMNVKAKVFTAPPPEVPAVLVPENKTVTSAVAQAGNEDVELPPAPRRLHKSLSGGLIETEKQSEESRQEENAVESATSEPTSAQAITPAESHSDLFEENASAFKAGKARKLPVNADLMLAKGTFIQCSLRTKLVSTVSGAIGCIVANDVYSANGTVLLIEKGSSVFGEFKSGQIQQGEERLFVVWTEIRTPKNVVININSGATDELGGTGINGYVDNHFWQRFGNAIMLSMISDTTSALSTQLAKRGTFQPNDTVAAGGEIAQSILEKTVNIPPTLYKNHGDLVGIFVARDIDFSDVYTLRKK